MEYVIVREKLQEEFNILCEDKIPCVALSGSGAMILRMHSDIGILRVDVPLYSAIATDNDEHLFKLIAQLNSSATAQLHSVFYSLTPLHVLHVSSLLNYRIINDFSVIANKLNAMTSNASSLRKLIIDYIHQEAKPTSDDKPSDLLRQFSFA